MSGDSYYFGDSVSMHGGSKNVGVVKNQAASAAQAGSLALQGAIQELLQLIRELRDQVPPVSAQTIVDSLPSISANGGTPPAERHRALMAIAGIAATVGTVGRPVLDAVDKILELLGAH